ncbi:MAG: hypothetical protein CMJ49_13210 [Planctomycetaceae bacterium]|nr:hypothetical protein [Planctomycetaceae bacterium]
MTSATQDIFDQVLLRAAVAALDDDGSAMALLSWVAPDQGDRLVQVYVNDVLADVSVDASQREMWLHLDRARPVRVELLAVDPQAALNDHATDLHGWSPRFTQRAALAITRDETLPVESVAIVSVDDAEDFGHRLWRDTDYRSGFGALFGIGEFARDGATGPGLGRGEFGVGQFGADGCAWRWQRGDLSPGAHTIDLRMESPEGREVGRLDAPLDVYIDALPSPAKGVQLDDVATLSWQT